MEGLPQEAGYMTASAPKRVVPFESPLTARAGPYMYLHPAAKYHRLTHRLSQEQKDLDERALMTSQRPTVPWRRPRRGPCGRTSSAQAALPCRFPPPGLLIPPLAAATAARETA